MDFCSKFNYPEEIQALLEKAVKILEGKDVLSIMALGSLPRGELSYRTKNGSLELFSDIDILVITKGDTNKKEQFLLREKLKELERIFQPGNPLFDINIEFFALQEFKRLPFKVRFYELKESGKTLSGQDLRHVIPKFGLENLNVKDTNNIVRDRLLHVLLYFPRELLEGKKNDFSQDVFKYILARNALDITTVALFQRGIFLSTYSERVKYVVANSGTFVSDFGSDFPRFLTRCLKVKLNMDFNEPLMSLFEDVLKYFRLLLVYTLRNNGIDMEKSGSLLPLIRKSKNDIFGDSDITKAKSEFLLRSPSLNLLQKRLTAVSNSFLGCVVFFLLNINESAYLFLRADRSCLSVLDDSWWALMRLGILGGEEFIPADFVGRFLVLRKKFFFDFYIKFMAPRLAEYADGILNWKYE